MKPALVAGMVLAALAACDQGAAPGGAEADSAAAEAPSPAATQEGVALDAIDACMFTQAEVSVALGGSYGAGVPMAPIPGAPRRDCTYDEQGGGNGQLRVNVTWLEPSSAATSRQMMLNLLAGGTAPLAGDPDGAIFQDQTELGTYALHYSRGNLLYEVRLMTFRGGAAAAREKLLRLHRP